MTGADVVAEARTWLRTPYSHQGRSKGLGVDCAGLVIGVARNLGLVAPDFDVTGYSRQPDGTLIERCGELMRAIVADQIAPGDVLATKFDQDPCHLAIVGDHPHGLSIIHALCRSNGRGMVVEHRLDTINRARIVGAFRLGGLD